MTTMYRRQALHRSERARFPRTLVEAFGPHTSTHFEPDPPISIFRLLGVFVLRHRRRFAYGLAVAFVVAVALAAIFYSRATP